MTTGVSRVFVTEVGPRDGLQNESEVVPTDSKVAFVRALLEAGHTDVEVGAFVRPDRVPAMADTADANRLAARAIEAGGRILKLLPQQQSLESLFVDEMTGVDRIARAQPVQEVGVEPDQSVRLSSGLFVAGDHRQNASINGALLSGRRAGEAVAARLCREC